MDRRGFVVAVASLDYMIRRRVSLVRAAGRERTRASDRVGGVGVPPGGAGARRVSSESTRMRSSLQAKTHPACSTGERVRPLATENAPSDTHTTVAVGQTADTVPAPSGIGVATSSQSLSGPVASLRKPLFWGLPCQFDRAI